MNFKQSLKSIAVACSLAAATAAQAGPVLFDSVGDNQLVTYESQELTSFLKATVDFTLTGLTSSTATFNVVVKNLSTGAGLNNLFAFGVTTVTPSLTSVGENSTLFSAGVSKSFAGFDTIDLCVYAGGTCGTAQPTTGLGMGQTNTFTLTLNTAGSFTNGVTFDSPYTIAFKGVGSALSTKAVTFESNPIPEPSSIALTGLVLVGLVGAGRAARKAA